MCEGSGKPEHCGPWELSPQGESDEWEGQGESMKGQDAQRFRARGRPGKGKGGKRGVGEKRLVHLCIRTSNSYLALTVQTQEMFTE